MTTEPNDHTIGRREALRVGGMTLSLAAIVAACGEERGGSEDPGRIGNAAPVTDLADYEVNDAVLLRTASSLEYTAIAVLNAGQALVDYDEGTAALIDRLIANHTATAATMAGLTIEAGGQAWNQPNPWYMERSIEPILETIAASDDVERDITSLAITFENVAASTHQSLTGMLSESAQRVAAANAAAQESRHAATLTLKAFGTAGRYSPALIGEEVTRTADNVARQFAIPTQFGSVAQIEVIVGAADENGTRTTYTIATPAANSYIYEEL